MFQKTICKYSAGLTRASCNVQSPDLYYTSGWWN